MTMGRMCQAHELSLGHLAPSEGLEFQGWRARWERTCRAGRACYPEGGIRFEVGIIFGHQDLLESGMWRGAGRRASGELEPREVH